MDESWVWMRLLLINLLLVSRRGSSWNNNGYGTHTSLSILCFSACTFSCVLLTECIDTKYSWDKGFLGKFAKGCTHGLLDRPAGSKHSFISWRHAHFQICLKGKGNFLLTAYSISKHLVKASFLSFITGHDGDGKN